MVQTVEEDRRYWPAQVETIYLWSLRGISPNFSSMIIIGHYCHDYLYASNLFRFIQYKDRT